MLKIKQACIRSIRRKIELNFKKKPISSNAIVPYFNFCSRLVQATGAVSCSASVNTLLIEFVLQVRAIAESITIFH